MSIVIKAMILIAAEAVIFAALLFAGAGTLRWPAGWAFMAIFFGSSVVFAAFLSRHDPALLVERMKIPVQEGQPLWDRMFLLILLARSSTSSCG